jgi:hypothetical protein
MSWKQGLFNVVCNLLAAVILKLFDTNAAGPEIGFWQTFLDWRLNYVVFFVVLNFLFVSVVTNKQKKQFTDKIQTNRNAQTVLKNMWAGKTNNECALWDFGKYGYSVVPCNDTWAQWISNSGGHGGLVVAVARPDLDYYNFGDEFYFFNLMTGNKIDIPTGDKARREKVGSSVRNGMVLRLMPSGV